MLKVSSSATKFHVNFIPLYLGIVFFAGGVAEWHRNGFSWSNVILLGLLLLLLLIVILSLKKLTGVTADEKFIYLARNERLIEIELTSVTRVNQGILGILSNPEIAFIELDEKSELGSKIYFTPPFRILNLGVHPVVKELQQLVDAAKLKMRT